MFVVDSVELEFRVIFVVFVSVIVVLLFWNVMLVVLFWFLVRFERFKFVDSVVLVKLMVLIFNLEVEFLLKIVVRLLLVLVRRFLFL